MAGFTPRLFYSSVSRAEIHEETGRYDPESDDITVDDSTEDHDYAVTNESESDSELEAEERGLLPRAETRKRRHAPATEVARTPIEGTAGSSSQSPSTSWL